MLFSVTSPRPPEEARSFRAGRSPDPRRGGPKPGQPRMRSVHNRPSALSSVPRYRSCCNAKPSNMRTSYKVRAYPTVQQEAVLNARSAVRLVWNKVLAWRHARYHTEQITTSYAE